jgi:hypothetical protein
VDADAELDATLRWKTRVAFDHPVLHLYRTTHGVDDASKLDENSIPRPLDAER